MNTAIRKATENFSETAIDDEIVVMSLASGDFYSLTGTAREIWLLIDGARDRAALIDQLCATYDTPAATVAEDVDAFLADLGGAGLLVQV